MVNPIIAQLEGDYIKVVSSFAGELAEPYGDSHRMFFDLIYDDRNLYIRNNINTENLFSMGEYIEKDNQFDKKISKVFKDYKFCAPSVEIIANSITFIPDADLVISDTLDFFLDQGLSIDHIGKVEIEKNVWGKNMRTGEASMVRAVVHSKSDYSILFESVFGELTENEAKLVLETGDFGSAVPSCIFMFWMSLHYNE